MAFPTIPTGGRILTARTDTPGTTHTFPSLTGLTKNAGDLLVAIVVTYDGNSTNAEFSGWGGSFTEFADFATTTTVSIGAAYKVSTGSETGTFTVTSSGSAEAGLILMSIAGAQSVEAGGYATGTLANADPGAFDPTGWNVEDTLWIAVMGVGETSTGGTWTGAASAPANYSGYVDTAVVNDVVGAVEAAVAFRQNAVASEDPGAFTNDASNTRWGACTIAVRPAALPQTVNLTAATATWTAAVLTATGSAATVSITAATAQWAASVLSPSVPPAEQPQTVDLVAPVATWSASALTATGATATVNLVAGQVTWSAAALTATGAPATVDLVATTAGWSASTLDVSVASGDTWTIGSNVVQGTVTVTALTVNLTAPTATWTAQALTVTGSAQTVSITAISATWSASALAPSGAALTVQIVAAVATWTVEPLSPSVFTGLPQTVDLVAAVVTWAASAFTTSVVDARQRDVERFVASIASAPDSKNLLVGDRNGALVKERETELVGAPTRLVPAKPVGWWDGE